MESNGDVENQSLAPFSTPLDLMNLVDTVSYFLHLKMQVFEKNASFTVPPAVDKIIELARGLPLPQPEEWGSLAVGRIPTKRKFRSNGADEDKGVRRRGTWTAESKEELVEMVENDDLRRKKMKDGTKEDGSVNWASLARRYGFSNAGPVQRQYELLTGKGERMVLSDETSVWEDHEKSSDLIRLVQNAAYRYRTLGTELLDWQLVARHLGVTQESARKKYHEMTGQYHDGPIRRACPGHPAD